MEDGPQRTDNPVTSHLEQTKDQRIQRECRCGWSKVTTYLGLRIHQGKQQLQTCTAPAGQTSRYHSQVEHHRASDTNSAVGLGEQSATSAFPANPTATGHPSADPHLKHRACQRTPEETQPKTQGRVAQGQ